MLTTLLLLVLLVGSVAAFVKPDFRASLLSRVGVTANTPTSSRVISIVNGVLVYAFGAALFGGLVGLVVLVLAVAYVNRDRIGLR